ncbi:DUF1254 domain-containing protein [Roseomonas sp. CAU 1739]|uniref:DUF1254 domain-containing protein n=1 Tax=Roseomonas sp. CAU 1739 TaxID=3140364 RepID=UPI00325C1564
MNKRDLLRASALAGASLTLPRVAAAQADRPGIIGAKDIAEEGFIFGLPIVMNYAVMYEFAIDRASSQFKAPFNEIYNEARVATYQDTAVVTPNSDTPYSICWLDLRAEPMVLSIPAVDRGRYLSVQVIDGNTYNVGYMGSRTTGPGAATALIAPPGWQGEAPAGVTKIIRSTTHFALALFRTQLFTADDMPSVTAIQRGFKAQPLSAFLNRAAPAPAPAISWPRVDADLVKKHFFAYLDFALRFNPPQPNEADIRAKLARIGVGAGPGMTAGGSSLFDRLEVDLGLWEGNRKVEAAVAAAGVDMNDWRVTDNPGSPEAYNGNWQQRAVVAKAGIYANDTAEAAYPFTRNDVNGNAIDCSKGNYTITFPAGQLPPVNAFWSVTMYDGHTQLLIQNPINRYLINAPMLPNLKRNADGSVTLYVQHASPGAEKESNWLPAPNGTAYLVMRLYWPKTEAPSLLPVGRGAWKPPGIVPAS